MANAKQSGGGLILPGDEASTGVVTVDQAQEDAAAGDAAQVATEPAGEPAPDPAAEAPAMSADAELAAKFDQLETKYLEQSDRLAMANAELASLRDEVKALREAAPVPAGGIISVLRQAQDERNAQAGDAAIAEAAAAAEKARKKAEKEAERAAKERAASVEQARSIHEQLLGDPEAVATSADLAAFLRGEGSAALYLSDGATFDIDFHPEVSFRDVTPVNDGITLNAALDPPVDGDKMMLSAAVLVFGMKCFSRCAVGPVPIGGGSSARLPEQSLLFRFAEPAARV